MAVPVGGNVIQANDVGDAQNASNLRPMCRLLQVTTGTNLASGTQGTLLWDTEDYDYGGLHAAGSANVVITKAGVYRVAFTLHLPARADYLTVGAVIQKNGVNQPPWIRQQPGTANAQRTAGPVVANLLCAVADTISAAGFQQNTAAAAAVTPVGSSFESVLEVEYVREA